MDAAIYLRISEDRSGEQLGVQRQREDCEKLCTEKGWAPIEYLDNDTSATSGRRRPKYEQMLADIRDGRIGAVVVWDLDRLHRRPIELEEFMKLADEKHLALATVSGDVNLSTAQGRLVARLKGSVAAHEGEHRKARQLRATRQLAERGVPNWHKAFGYLGDSRQPDPAVAPLVKQAYAAILAGASLGDVARLWNEAGALTLGGNRWRHAEVSKYLRRPFVAGLRSHTHTDKATGERVTEIVGKGNWPAIVDEATWRSAQSVLNAPGRAPGRKSVRRHLLTGILRCGKPGCGGYLSGAYVGKETKQLTYICKGCHGINIRAANIEPMLYQLVGGRLAMDDARDLLKAEQHDQAEAEALRLEANTLLNRLDEIADERADGLLTGKQAQRATDRINEKLAAIERRQQDAERLRVFDGLDLGKPQVQAQVRKLSPDRFRAVVSVLMDPTVMPVGRGNHNLKFNPGRVKENWHQPADVPAA
ncbi:recombinase family protein [Mycobacterium colombiense]